MLQRLVVMALLVGCSVHHAVAQKTTYTQEGYLWQHYYFKAQLSDRWELHFETERRSLNVTRYRTVSLLPRIHAHYLFKNNMNLGAGISHFMTNQIVTSDLESYPVRSEVRFHQVWTINQPFGRYKLSHRYQVEERLYLASYNDQYLNSPTPFDYGFRFRYMIQFQARLTPAEKKVHVLFHFYDELLLQTSPTAPNSVFEANRFYGALEVKFSPVWGLEAGYLTWIQQKTSSTYFVPHMCRITLHHTLDLRKKKD
jgi:hypothetical protein